MSRSLDAATAAAAIAEQVMRTTAVLLDLDGGAVRVNGAPWDVPIDGDTYYGVGTLGSISAVEEAAELQSASLTLALSGIPRDLLNQAMTETTQNRAVRIWELVLNTTTHAVIGTPVTLFRGRIDEVSATLDGASATVAVTVTNRLADWERPKNSLFSDEQQQREHAGDLGFQYAAAMETRRIIWPVGTYPG